MPSNFTILLLGLFIGLFSTFYPQIPSYLPESISKYISSSSLTESSSWSTYSRYQATIPIIENHDPFAEKLDEVEKKMRMGSKIDKEIVGKDDFSRVESAGTENRLHENVPNYFIELYTGGKVEEWRKVGREIINVVRPERVIVLSSLHERSPQIEVSKSSSSSEILSLIRDPSHPVIPAAITSRGVSENVSKTLAALFGENKIEIVQISLPFTVGSGQGPSYILEVGRRLRALRTDTLILSFGSVTSTDLLHDILINHTAEPREDSLSSMISGNKPSKKVLVSESMMGLVAAVGAADEGEGERLNVGWRFGHLPMRQS